MTPHAGRRLLVIEAAGLTPELRDSELPELRPIRSVFPAVTCTVQATFRTALPPRAHGMIANGLFHRDLRKVLFWEQSAALVAGERIWSSFRRRGGTVGLLFWQQSLAEDADVILSPAPIHKHHGGMIEDCYSRPAGLYEALRRRVGRPFRLRHYWGPMASWKAGRWIADATAALLADARLAPDLCLTYLPTLDYDLQRYGDLSNRRGRAAAAAVRRQIGKLLQAAGHQGYDVLLFGDYRIVPVSSAVQPNAALKEAGLLRTRSVRGMLYADLHASDAFAVADHQVAHVYLRDEACAGRAKDILIGLPGVAEVLDESGKAAAGIDHPNSGQLVLIAEHDKWFAYPWWDRPRQAPDYARHVDIHNKPGFDPCELFFGCPPPRVSLDPTCVRGSHGRVGPGREVAWYASFDLPAQPKDLLELARLVRERLNQT